MERGCGPQDKRKLLYKPCSPTWKDTYKQRCRDSLRARRMRFLDAVRCSGEAPTDRRPSSADQVAEVMTEEWERMRRSKAELPSAMEVLLSEPGGDEDLDQALSIWEQIQKELRKEEEHEHGKSQAFSEALLCEAMQDLDTDDTDDTDEVCCPVCQRHNLLQNKSVVFCACGMRVDTKQDCLTMVQIRQRIDSAVSAHEAVCSGKPQFSMVSAAGFQNVDMLCEMCDLLQDVI